MTAESIPAIPPAIIPAPELHGLRSSSDISDIAAALAKAQAGMHNPIADKSAKIEGRNGNFQYRYTDLASVLGMVRPALNQHEISILQPVSIERGQAIVRTVLLHSSGQWLESDPTSLTAAGTPQQIGSVISYARRYNLLAFLGLAAEDDDGSSASGSGAGRSQTRGARANPEPPGQQDAPAEPKLAESEKAQMTALKTHLQQDYGLADSEYETTMQRIAKKSDWRQPASVREVLKRLVKRDGSWNDRAIDAVLGIPEVRPTEGAEQAAQQGATPAGDA